MLGEMKKDIYELVSLTKGIFLNDNYPEEYKLEHRNDNFFSVKCAEESIEDLNSLPYVRVSETLYPMLREHWEICKPVILSFVEDFKSNNITIYRVENVFMP